MRMTFRSSFRASIRARLTVITVVLGVSMMLSACAETELVSHLFKKTTWAGSQETAGSYKVGNPYTVSGVRYHPREDFSMTETGIASWYGPNFHGKRTANGEIYDQNALTAAHRTLQMPSLVRVTNLQNGKSVVVRINDRGPFKRGRVIDVSKKAASLLGFINQGTAKVRIEVLEKESRQIAEAAKRGMDTSKITLAELNKLSPQQPTRTAATARTQVPVLTTVPANAARPVQVASLKNDAEFLPESLQTPTITVEELSAPGAKTSNNWGTARQAAQPQPAPQAVKPQAAPTKTDRDSFVQNLGLENRTASDTMASGTIQDGRFMPDPVVTRAPVNPTGIFVQAGSFTVRDNAERLSQKLSRLGPVLVDPVMVSGRQFWRVRVGPIDTVETADGILDEVIRIGGTGKVVR
jgi:rare lipoprotein A